MNELLRVENLKKSFWIDHKEISVLNGVHFSVQAGERIAIVGASGAGKSTLLHMLGALDVPTEGSIIFKGAGLHKKSEKELAQFRNQEIGFVFQFHHLLNEFTAIENVMVPAWISGMRQKESRERAEEKLLAVGLGHRLNHKPQELSGGEQSRVALARALVLNPSLLLADEPTGNLDMKTSEQIQELLTELHAQYKMTMILVTHNELLAKKMPKLFQMQDGTLIQT